MRCLSDHDRQILAIVANNSYTLFALKAQLRHLETQSAPRQSQVDGRPRQIILVAHERLFDELAFERRRRILELAAAVYDRPERPVAIAIGRVSLAAGHAISAVTVEGRSAAVHQAAWVHHLRR